MKTGVLVAVLGVLAVLLVMLAAKQVNVRELNITGVSITFTN